MKVYIDPKPREAIKFKPQVSIPGTNFTAGKSIDLSSKTIGEYIAGLYYFIIASIGLLAVIGIMIGGFQYLVAGGSPEKITSAKSTIMGAITGLIIALTSYLIFYTINPRLVEFDQALSTLDKNSITGQGVNINMNFGPQACVETEKKLLSIADSSIWGTAPIRVGGGVEPPPRLMSQIVAKLKDPELVKWLDSLNLTLVITSAYRTMANQAGLRGCYDYKESTTSSPAGCPYQCSSCNQAATPSCDAPHQTGFAVDVCIEAPAVVANNAPCNQITQSHKPTDGIALELQKQMYDAGLDRFCKEWWHFESGQDLGTHASSHCDPGEYVCPGGVCQDSNDVNEGVGTL